MDTIEDLIETVAWTAIFLMAILVAFQLRHFGFKYEEMQIDANLNKPSIEQSYAYIDAEKTFSRSEVLTDILSGEKSVKVSGATIPNVMLTNARLGKSDSIRNIKNSYVTRSSYKKTYIYDSNGDVQAVSYY